MPEEHDNSLFHERSANTYSSAPTPAVYPEPLEGMVAPTPDFTTTKPVTQSVSDEAPKTLSITDTQSNGDPVPVVRVLSVRGVEYLMMSFALWLGAGSLIWVLLALINGYGSTTTLAMPGATMIVSVPVFAFFFLRLRKQELVNSSLRYEPSKRRLTQITQFVAFITCMLNTVTFVYLMIAKVSGQDGIVLWKAFANLLIVLIVVGGILAYYWADEHRTIRD
ncbi:hypothetical protein HY003_03885 [Candidatus Saccharibacteria bacterium]|nr:hypothetical protein [Candidatus Saccharibacteria bacterium]MBI3338413.1 hypothetical protein [Candidatus Saccharibacteria bacterium]